MTTRNTPTKRKGIRVQTRTIPGGSILGGDPDRPPKIEITNSMEVIQGMFDGLEAYAKKNGIAVKDLGSTGIEIALKNDPGLQLYSQKKSGRPNKWDGFSAFFLWWDVEALRRKSKNPLSVSSACNVLKKRSPWKSEGNSLSVAYSRYAEEFFMTKMTKALIEQFGWEKTAEVFKELLENREEFLDRERERLKNR
jgi:hypothetical protein